MKNLKFVIIIYAHSVLRSSLYSDFFLNKKSIFLKIVKMTTSYEKNERDTHTKTDRQTDT